MGYYAAALANYSPSDTLDRRLNDGARYLSSCVVLLSFSAAALRAQQRLSTQLTPNESLSLYTAALGIRLTAVADPYPSLLQLH